MRSSEPMESESAGWLAGAVEGGRPGGMPNEFGVVGGNWRSWGLFGGNWGRTGGNWGVVVLVKVDM